MHEGEKQPMMKIQEKTKDEADYDGKQRDKHCTGEKISVRKM